MRKLLFFVKNTTAANKLESLSMETFSGFIFTSYARGLYYKTIHNLRILRKLVSFLLSVTFNGLDKHTSLVHYKSIMF